MKMNKGTSAVIDQLVIVSKDRPLSNQIGVLISAEMFFDRDKGIMSSVFSMTDEEMVELADSLYAHVKDH